MQNNTQNLMKVSGRNNKKNSVYTQPTQSNNLCYPVSPPSAVLKIDINAKESPGL